MRDEVLETLREEEERRRREARQVRSWPTPGWSFYGGYGLLGGMTVAQTTPPPVNGQQFGEGDGSGGEEPVGGEGGDSGGGEGGGLA